METTTAQAPSTPPPAPTPTPTPPPPNEPTPPPQPPPPPPTTTTTSLPATVPSPPPPSSSTSSTPIPITTSTQNPNPNSTPTPIPISTPTQNPQPTPPPLQQQQQQSSLQQSQPRPQLNRPRLPTSNYSTQFSPHIPSPSPTSSSSSSSTAFSPSLSSPAPTTSSIQRGGIAIGVPAHQQRPPSQPAPFSTYGQSPFNQQFGALGRNPINVPDSNTSQVKQPIQGLQTTIGNFGSLSSTSQIRPGGISPHNQARTVQPTMRSQTTPTNQPLANQKFQGHPLLRGPSMGTPSSPSPGTPQVMQSHTQPWMAAPNQGKQMHPPSTSSQYRQQVKPPTSQQRSHHPQQHNHPISTVSHQQMPSSQQLQQQPVSQMHQSQEHYGQQYPGTRIPHQQQTQRVIGSGNQKITTTTAQTGPIQLGTPSIVGNVDAGESSSHILTKRSIHELVSQIDPSEKLDPEVEDILMEIAEDFVDSITTVGCSLAKHRKSTTLEAKDILLHLERNWHMSLPGFGGDEIKGYKKQLTSDIHKERLAAVKKSMVVPDAVVTKSSGGQAAGNVKGHPAKAPATG